jgi:predicted transcriptional regulator
MKPNKNAMTMFNSDQKKIRIMTLLRVKDGLEAAEIAVELDLPYSVCNNSLSRMNGEYLVTREKYLCSKSQRYVWKYYVTDTEFIPRTYAECLQDLKNMHTTTALESRSRGKYDDIIDTNPNRRVFAGKTSLFETKDKDYFLNGQRDKVNRAVASTWSLFDYAS